MAYSSSESGKSDEEDSSRVGWNNVYKRSIELVLVLLSDSYSLLESISVGVSGPSFCSTSYYLLTTLTTNYCF